MSNNSVLENYNYAKGRIGMHTAPIEAFHRIDKLYHDLMNTNESMPSMIKSMSSESLRELYEKLKNSGGLYRLSQKETVILNPEFMKIVKELAFEKSTVIEYAEDMVKQYRSILRLLEKGETGGKIFPIQQMYNVPMIGHRLAVCKQLLLDRDQVLNDPYGSGNFSSKYQDVVNTTGLNSYIGYVATIDGSGVKSKYEKSMEDRNRRKRENEIRLDTLAENLHRQFKYDNLTVNMIITTYISELKSNNEKDSIITRIPTLAAAISDINGIYEDSEDDPIDDIMKSMNHMSVRRGSVSRVPGLRSRDKNTKVLRMREKVEDKKIEDMFKNFKLT